MKYWAYLIAKLAAVGGLLYGIRWVIGRTFPTPDTFMYVRPEPFAHDLAYTFLMLLYSLFAAVRGRF